MEYTLLALHLIQLYLCLCFVTTGFPSDTSLPIDVFLVVCPLDSPAFSFCATVLPCALFSCHVLRNKLHAMLQFVSLIS